MRGGEKVLEGLCALFPHADLYTLLHVKGTSSEVIERMAIRTSFLQHLPLAGRFYRYYLPLFPAAVTRFDLHGYDLVISSHHCVAKGVRTGPGTLHLCYCHTPMRYLWSMYDEYFGPGRSGLPTRMGARLFRNALRKWDLRTAGNPASYIANSEHIRGRIRDVYQRDAVVIHPPVDVQSFQVSYNNAGYYLVAGALVPYKRVDLAIEAFSGTHRKLVIAGDGPEAGRLRKIAGPNVEFRGRVSDSELRSLYAGCRALVFPGEEDFGIVPLEVMACGKPVVAFGKGGALETVVDGTTGLLFAEQSPESLLGAVGAAERRSFDAQEVRKQAMRFDKGVFLAKMGEYVAGQWESFVRSGRGTGNN
jgi:glycosyltransferase involved in cell wall biosynthesis